MTKERKHFRQTFFICLALILCFTLFHVLQDKGHAMDLETDDEMLAVSIDGGETQFLKFSDIEEVQYTETIGEFELEEGNQDENFISGTCQTSLYGEVKIGAYTGVDAFIVIETGQERLIYNLSTVKKTKEVYEKLAKS